MSFRSFDLWCTNKANKASFIISRLDDRLVGHFRKMLLQITSYVRFIWFLMYFYYNTPKRTLYSLFLWFFYFHFYLIICHKIKYCDVCCFALLNGICHIICFLLYWFFIWSFLIFFASQALCWSIYQTVLLMNYLVVKSICIFPIINGVLKNDI